MDDVQYVSDDYEMADFYDDLLDYHWDSESEEEDATDTSAEEARRGKDVQGIAWDKLNYTREHYREIRMEHHRNFEKLPRFRKELDKVRKETQKGGNFYEFRHSTRLVKPSIVHYQLRNMVSATSKHDVYVVSNYCIIHWSSLFRKATGFFNAAAADHIVPAGEGSGITTMAVKGKLLVAGGFRGDLICKFLDQTDVSYISKVTENEKIMNSVELYSSSSGATPFMTSSNDCIVRVLEVNERFACIRCLSFPWFVNHTSLSPDNKLLLVAGDNVGGLLLDCETGKTVASLEGHLDDSFASAWHPVGLAFATGNQDTTCRPWDVRNTTSLEVLKGNLGAIRSVRFSSDGQFMAMAEPADFVHIYDTKQNYNKNQEIDFFGEIAVISFSPDTESLFIGAVNPPFSSLLEYSRGHECFYLDSLT